MGPGGDAERTVGLRTWTQVSHVTSGESLYLSELPWTGPAFLVIYGLLIGIT